jgi:segregation and condensation protein B
MSDANISKMNLALEARLEALVFVASGPVSAAQLSEALGETVIDVEAGLRRLEGQLTAERGLRLQWHAGRVQLTTAPELGSLVEHYLGLEATSRLSRAALETLAIIAYRQPITRPTIDSIRGVNSDGVVKSLLSKVLVEEVGRTEGPGRPILYGTTSDFLQHFGLSSLQALPPYEITESSDDNLDKKILKV